MLCLISTDLWAIEPPDTPLPELPDNLPILATNPGDNSTALSTKIVDRGDQQKSWFSFFCSSSGHGLSGNLPQNHVTRIRSNHVGYVNICVISSRTWYCPMTNNYVSTTWGYYTTSGYFSQPDNSRVYFSGNNYAVAHRYYIWNILTGGQ